MARTLVVDIASPPVPQPRQAQPQIRALTAAQEQALRPKDAFRECDACPEMVVVPVGLVRHGVAGNEPKRVSHEGPQRKVVVASRFAVGRLEVTFDQWDACVADGGCNAHRPVDDGRGRGRQPVINVSWNDAKAYVAWLSGRTGKTYRLLTEAEWEYAARAGTTTTYPWGAQIGFNNANCEGCGSQWEKLRAAPAGSFSPNAFGLHDMNGNLWEWVEDCYNNSFSGAPTDGSAWLAGNCGSHVLRGGSWRDRHTTSARRPARVFNSVPEQRCRLPHRPDVRPLRPGREKQTLVRRQRARAAGAG